MRIFLMAQGFEVLKFLVNGYTTPTTPPTEENGKRIYEINAKVMNVILSSLSGSKCVKVMHCDSAKDIWDKLHNIYEGDDKVNRAKLQRHRTYFEVLKVKEDEDIVAYFFSVDEVVNTIRGLGE